MSTQAEWRGLWCRYLDGADLSAEDVQVLVQALTTDETFAEACLADQCVSGLLHERHQDGKAWSLALAERLRLEESDQAGSFIKRVQHQLPRQPSGGRRHVRGGRVRRSARVRPAVSKRLPQLLVAALVLLLVTVGSVVWYQSRSPRVAFDAQWRVVSFQGQPELIGDAGAGPLALAQLLPAPSRIQLQAEDQLSLHANGHRLQASHGAALQFQHLDGSGVGISVTAGQLTCSVSPLQAGQAFIVRSPDAVVRVVGTRFTVRYQPDAGTVVSVREGQVSCLDRHRHARHQLQAGDVLRIQPMPSSQATQARQTAGATPQQTSTVANDRLAKGMVGHWSFADMGSDATVVNARGDAETLLQVRDREHVRRLADGLELVKPTQISSAQPARRLLAAIQEAGACSIVVDLTPRGAQASFNTAEIGPARIVSWSFGSEARNFTLGQGALRQTAPCYSLRLQRQADTRNGMPTLIHPVVEPGRRVRLTVVLTARDGLRWYCDGVLVHEEQQPIDFAAWQAFHLSLGSEIQVADDRGERPWLGRLHALTIYARALKPSEIK